MAKKNQNGKLVIPALRAHMGDWIYYITFMKMQDIAERISVAEEIHTSNTLKELIQREVDKSRAADQIKTYLLMQRQRLFNAMVIGVYGGSPKWYEMSIERNRLYDAEELPRRVVGVPGILVLQGSEKLFAIDGQHRVVGIRYALKEKASLGDEEVGTIFVAHKNDKKGMERTRRLFTTLNRYAKPVSKKGIIALDEDDVLAIVTRRLVDEYALFKDKLSLANSKNLPPTDRKNFTTIVTLYQVLEILLRKSVKELEYGKRLRPDDAKIDEFYEQACDFWQFMVASFPPLLETKRSAPSKEIPAKYRNKDGGHILFRPVGLLMVSKVIQTLHDVMGMPLRESVQRVARAPMNLADEPWADLLWDTINHRMITAPENQKVALRVLFNSLGGDLAIMKTDREHLRIELAGILKRQVEQVQLPVYV